MFRKALTIYMWSKKVLGGPVCKMLLVVPNVNYYLSPAEVEFQIPRNRIEKRDRMV